PIEIDVAVAVVLHGGRRGVSLLQEDHRVLRRDVELLPACLARHRIVDADHVVAELEEQRAIALVGAGRNPILARPYDPAHLVLIDAPAARTGELVGPRLAAAVEEVAFVERHDRIILSGWRPNRSAPTPASCRCWRCGRRWSSR